MNPKIQEQTPIHIYELKIIDAQSIRMALLFGFSIGMFWVGQFNLTKGI